MEQTASVVYLFRMQIKQKERNEREKKRERLSLITLIIHLFNKERQLFCFRGKI